MSQASLTLADSNGATFLAALNAALLRLATQGSGTGRPSDIQTYETWVDTDTPGTGVVTWYLYDGASDITIGTVNTSTHKFAIDSGVLDALLGSTKGMLAKRGASSWAGLALGTALHHLRMNAAADDVEFFQAPAVISDQALSGAASVAWQNIPSGYNHLICLFDLLPGTDGAAIQARLYHSNVEDTTASYTQVLTTMNSAAGVGAGNLGVTTSWRLFATLIRAAADEGGLVGALFLPNYKSTTYSKVFGIGGSMQYGTNYLTLESMFGQLRVAGPVDGLKLFPSTGTFSGRAALIGL